MRPKQHIDYIYCTCRQTKWQWEIMREQGCCTLHIEFGRLTQKSGMKKAARLVRRFETQNVVIGADGKAACLLQMEDALFAARQQELLWNQRYILDVLLSENREISKGRRRFLLVLEDPHWGWKELWQCILGVKDRFEDIAVCVVTPEIEIDWIIEDIYREWGIVIDIVSTEQIRQQYFRIVYFLVKRWRETLRLCCNYQAAYLVSYEQMEKETHMIQERGSIYAGLKYMIQERKLREDYARNLAYQQPKEYEKKGVSVVAICGRE